MPGPEQLSKNERMLRETFVLEDTYVHQAPNTQIQMQMQTGNIHTGARVGGRSETNCTACYHLPLPVSGSGSSPAGEGGRPLSPSLYSLPLPVSGLGSSPAGEGGRPITHKQTGQFMIKGRWHDTLFLRQRKRSEGCVKHMSHKRNSTRSCRLTLA